MLFPVSQPLLLCSAVTRFYFPPLPYVLPFPCHVTKKSLIPHPIFSSPPCLRQLSRTATPHTHTHTHSHTSHSHIKETKPTPSHVAFASLHLPRRCRLRCLVQHPTHLPQPPTQDKLPLCTRQPSKSSQHAKQHRLCQIPSITIQSQRHTEKNLAPIAPASHTALSSTCYYGPLHIRAPYPTPHPLAPCPQSPSPACTHFLLGH